MSIPWRCWLTGHLWLACVQSENRQTWRCRRCPTWKLRYDHFCPHCHRRPDGSWAP